MNTSLGTLLKEARKEKKLTLRELAQMIGYAPSFISEVENGIRPVPRKENFFAKISHALGINYDEILKIANEVRECTSMKRLGNIITKNQELSEIFYRVGCNLSDEEFKDLLLNMLKKLEMGEEYGK